jgi:lipoprotein-anchoring transpeptidase ErfK/SrfK
MAARFHRPRSAGAKARAASAGVLAVALLGGCTATADQSRDAETPDRTPEATPSVAAARVSVNVRAGATVPVDRLVTVSVVDGALRRLAVQAGEARVPGRFSDDRLRWTAQERLEPGTTYRLRAVVENEDGTTRAVRRTFHTQPLTLDQQTYASIAPLDGETVGVGMPVIVAFDIPVTDRAEVERHLEVTSAPAQRGSWHWISDREVHWRPKSYWKPGTRVTVDADINGVDAGNGIYGQEDRRTRFTVGDAVVMQVDVAAHQMRVLRNGELLRTMPVSGGKPGFTTRSGIKVIIEKFRTKDMDAATTGISEDDPEYYNVQNVEYAQRVTYSGEFIHAAPWSVGSQGSANVSHGCIGMSTADAGWLYSLTRRGDVVEVTGSERPMEPTNGFGDWNVPWPAYKAGSALS